MKAILIDNIEELNVYLATIKDRDLIDIKYQSEMVDVKKSSNKVTYEFVERFLVITK